MDMDIWTFMPLTATLTGLARKKPSAQFFGELTAVLETLVINACPVEIGGDFNVRFQLAADPDSRLLKPCEILCKCYTRELVA